MRLFRWPYNISLISLLLLPLLINLGLWQMDRGHYKQNRSTLLADRTQQPPVDDAWLGTDPSPWLLRLVELRYSLRWSDRVLLLDNFVRGGTPGVEVIQLVAHNNRAFLVNRGWIPWMRSDPLPDISLPQGEGLRGQLRPWPEKGLQLAEAPPLRGRANLVTGLDKESIEAWSGQQLANAVVYLAAEDGNAFSAPRRASGGVNAMRHYGYAVQWFALALALLGLNIWVWWRHAARSRTSIQ